EGVVHREVVDAGDAECVTDAGLDQAVDDELAARTGGGVRAGACGLWCGCGGGHSSRSLVVWVRVYHGGAAAAQRPESRASDSTQPSPRAPAPAGTAAR